MSHTTDFQEVQEMFPTATAERAHTGRWTYSVRVQGALYLLVTAHGAKPYVWCCEVYPYDRGYGSTLQEAFLAARGIFEEQEKARREIADKRLAWLDAHGKKFPPRGEL